MRSIIEAKEKYCNAHFANRIYYCKNIQREKTEYLILKINPYLCRVK